MIGKSHVETTGTTGTENAASIRVDRWQTMEFDVAYEVSANGDIVVEVANHEPGSGDWFEFDRIDTEADGHENVYQGSTTFPHVRVYADSGTLNDGDVEEIALSVRLTSS